jgi:hypothetical protein
MTLARFSGGIVKARTQRISFGSRLALNAVEAGAIERVMLRDYAPSMRRASRDDGRFLIHRDFFLTFPFRLTAPFDICAIVRLLVPRPRIAAAAATIREGVLAKAATGPVAAARFLAVHLRLEGDRQLLSAGLASVTAASLGAWWERHVRPLAQRSGVGSVYIATGRVDPAYIAAIRAVEPLPVIVKDDVLAQGTLYTGESAKRVTSHEAAMADVLVLRAADVAVVFDRSTLGIAVIGGRCAPPPPPSQRLRKVIEGAVWCRGNSDEFWFHTRRPCEALEAEANLRSIAATPREAAAELPPTEIVPLRGVFTYGVDTEGQFSALTYNPCGTPMFRDFCNFDLTL